jgi:SAM-dependent methyltransferase
MRIKYGWNPDYPDRHYWNDRTPLFSGMPKLFNLYLDLNDKKLRKFLKELKGEILDVGCGDGRFLFYADIGVDFSKGMLQRTKKLHRQKCLILASILNLPFKERAFSAVFTVDVLLHIEANKRNEAVEELNRVAINVYNFLSEDRTVIPFMLQFLRTLRLRPRIVVAYIALFLAFPFDRLRKLRIEPPVVVLRRLV